MRTFLMEVFPSGTDDSSPQQDMKMGPKSPITSYSPKSDTKSPLYKLKTDRPDTQQILQDLSSPKRTLSKQVRRMFYCFEFFKKVFFRYYVEEAFRMNLKMKLTWKV